MFKRMIQGIAVCVFAYSADPALAFDFGAIINKELGIPVDPVLPDTKQENTGKPVDKLSGFSTGEQVGSLKQALIQGAETAVSSLARENGYLGNDKVRIPLPENLQKADGLLRTFGMGAYADDLTASINRAAEKAAPEAKDLLIGAVSNMSVEDASKILTGENDAATRYFREHTETALAGKFKPVIAASMQQVKLAETYNQFAAKGAMLGMINPGDANLDDYITRKAMDGLYLMMAEQEKAIRANPLEATGNLAKKVFSAIRF